MKLSRLLRSEVGWLAFVIAGALFVDPQGLAQTPQANSSLPDAPTPQRPTTVTPPVAPGEAPVALKNLPANFLRDQKAIFTSPLHLRATDLKYVVPLGIATGLLLGSDQHSMTQLVRTNTLARSQSSTVSDVGVGAIAGLPAVMYGWSLFHYAPRAHETALLTGEAALDAYAVNEAVKIVTRRERPEFEGASGSFGVSAWNNGSFPSNHAALAWSMASVLGSAYPGWLSRLTVYSLATAVSVSRITANDHFPSDVLVGSASGWLIGHYVYRAHHNAALDLYSPGEMGQSQHLPPDPVRQRPPSRLEVDPDKLGSVFVPTDSWIYAALDRLIAMGFIDSASEGIRPWTRLECLRQLKEAQDSLELEGRHSPASRAQAELLIEDLHAELEHELDDAQSLQIDSLYARYGTIAGPALSDSYHFGQTWQNDFGRPLVRGASELAGFSVRARHDRLFFYVQEEYQGAAKPQAVSLNTRLYQASLDVSPAPGGPFPLPPPPSNNAISRQRPLDLYAGIAFDGMALSLGKQQLYWGPLVSGPLSFSANAEAPYSLRFVSTRPHTLPAGLATYRIDLVAGKLSGHSFPQDRGLTDRKSPSTLARTLRSDLPVGLSSRE